MVILQNHPKSQQRVRICAVIEKPVFRASLALSMLEIELYQISLLHDRGRSGYEITVGPKLRVFTGPSVAVKFISYRGIEGENAHFQPSAWGFLTTKHSRRFANDVALALREKILAGMDFRVANRL